MGEVETPFSEPRDGFLYLEQLILWLAREDGLLNSEDAETRWDEALKRVIEALVAGALIAEGADPQGIYAEIPHGAWPLASSRSEAGRAHFSPTAGMTSGGVLEAGAQRWIGIRVRKTSFVARWGEPPSID
jgi:hypothetical protein